MSTVVASWARCYFSPSLLSVFPPLFSLSPPLSLSRSPTPLHVSLLFPLRLSTPRFSCLLYAFSLSPLLSYLQLSLVVLMVMCLRQVNEDMDDLDLGMDKKKKVSSHSMDARTPVNRQHYARGMLRYDIILPKPCSNHLPRNPTFETLSQGFKCRIKTLFRVCVCVCVCVCVWIISVCTYCA